MSGHFGASSPLFYANGPYRFDCCLSSDTIPLDSPLPDWVRVSTDARVGGRVLTMIEKRVKEAWSFLAPCRGMGAREIRFGAGDRGNRSAVVSAALCAIPCLVMVVASGTRVAAETVSVRGRSAFSQNELPRAGFPGLPGITPDPVEALADAVGEDNTASAFGGLGGRGGVGGRRFPSLPGPQGGVGGASGDATAIAVTRESFFAGAEAGVLRAGVGGPGGSRGIGDPRQGPEGPLGVAGLPLAIADLQTSLPGSATLREAVADATARALGYSATRPTLGGGSAQARSRASVSGFGLDAMSTARAEGGGRPEGAVLRADAFAEQTAGRNAAAIANTFGDAARGVIGPAADQLPTAFARSTGARTYATATAEIESGLYFPPRVIGRTGPQFRSATRLSRGELRATARAESGPYRSAIARTRVWAGPTVEPAPVELNNQVSGSSGGLLSLEQIGYSFGNDLANQLIAENEGGGALRISVNATVLPDMERTYSGDTRYRVGDTILGDVIGTSTNGQDVRVSAAATAAGSDGDLVGGRLRLESLSDPTGQTRSRIHGQSNGGKVSASIALVEARGGFTGSEVKLPTAGRSIDYRNLVSGTTTGELTLSQFLRAGYGGARDVDAGDLESLSIDGSWRGGDANNEMVYDESVDRLRLVGRATGGAGGSLRSILPGGAAFLAGADSGSARTFIRGRNDVGDVIVFGESRAGDCILCTIDGNLRSGQAVVELEARTTGDGNKVFANFEDAYPGSSIQPLVGRAIANGFASRTPWLDEETRWDASSRVVGIAEGDSEVIAVAGSAIEAYSQYNRYRLVQALASAQGAGGSLVVARAESDYGGSGFISQNGDFVSGSVSDSTAVGLGRVESSARSTSTPTLVESDVYAGSASATASATGSEGFARADAWSVRALYYVSIRDTGVPDLRARVEGSVAGTTSVRVDVRGGSGLLDSSAMLLGGADGRMVVVGNPDAATRARVLQSAPGLGDEFDAHASARLVAAGQFGGVHSGTGQRSIESVLEITTKSLEGNERFLFSVFETTFIGNGFADLVVTLEDASGGNYFEASFDSIAAAIAFFATGSIDLGDIGLRAPGVITNPSELRSLLTMRMKATTSEGDGFSIGFAMSVVPEPSMALLLLLGLVALASGRGRSAHAWSHRRAVRA